jgi:hypothetical protein
MIIGAFGAIAVLVAQLGPRVRHLEREAMMPTVDQQRFATLEQAQARLALEVQTQARLAAAAQAQGVTELRALRDEFTTARVEQSATVIGARRAEKRAAAAARVSEITDEPQEERDTVAMPAPSPSGLRPKPGDDQGEATTVLGAEPPIYARVAPQRPQLAALAHADLIGSEDIADEAGPRRLGPEDKTPPRRGRASMLLPVFHETEEGGAA